MSFFSVIVTVYNKEDYILDTLNSIKQQSYSDYEIVLVNDGSTDKSLDIVSQFEHPNISVFSTKNNGVSKARNFGIEKANSNYLVFLDGDDVWMPYHLQDLKKLIDKYPKEHIFSTAYTEGKGKNLRSFQFTTSNKKIQKLNYFEGSSISSILHPSTIAIHKNVPITVGGFNPKYSNYEDIEYWFRIGLKYPVIFHNTPSVCIRKTKNSLTTSSFKIENHYFFEDYDDQFLNDKAFRKVLDINRYSLAALCKVNNEQEQFLKLSKKINSKNLHLIQRILLAAPKPIYLVLNKFKNLLRRYFN
ncbi:glycosyltransferase family 2 protein [Flavicella sediminum]|uniref:glycosyltransferase family 2 protein n=1 Tax=Flavicella sediminum TaxID=2585141 RepID=UPI00111E3F06|nr:glycosyltransferase family 2 protein [Flavicella sediminum]